MRSRFTKDSACIDRFKRQLAPSRLYFGRIGRFGKPCVRLSALRGLAQQHDGRGGEGGFHDSAHVLFTLNITFMTNEGPEVNRSARAPRY
jgi:hypothetical protein